VPGSTEPHNITDRRVTTMRTRFLAASIAGLALVLAPATLAAATAEPFVAYDTDAGGGQSASAHSTVAADAVTLTWAAEEDASEAGTSAETSDLGVEVTAGDTISVDYALLDGASAAAGAVRLFAYYDVGADTWSTAPDEVAAAPADVAAGTLSITAGQDGTLGTVGVVYDTSNGGVEGSVTFTALTVAGESVPFLPAPPPVPCEWDETLTAEDVECVEPDDGKTGDEDAVTEDEESTEDDTTPVAVPTDIPAGSASLPDTGAGALLLGLFGATLVAAGASLVLAQRRRVVRR
jgi:LPXTG-motif cell wall-anchored protein